ncbi:MAG TPA: sigma 54-interacting transcriptional regulator [Gemmata sp.]|nr:sigma 54-interacting transcriptional regulator [Gemmata sp.]
MATNRRLVIAASEPRHALAVQAHLQKALQFIVPTVPFEDVPDLLTPETDGHLLLLGIDLKDAAAIDTVVRETRAQQLPARIAVLESATARDLRLFDHLTPFLAGRWTWPEQGKELSLWSRQSLEPGTPFADVASETIEERLRRRLINHTPSLTMLVEKLSIAAAQDVCVLIEGESGTGKSFLARLIHDTSARRAKRFMSLSCGSLTPQGFASELFGHMQGSCNGAEAAKVGKLTAVGDGTLLVDEVDALGHEQQSNLLRVLDTNEFEPVGSNETQINAARIIVTTNWSLADAVERGTFRRDLYYRLHVLSFHLPPLRHRPEDIGPLVRGMLARYATRFGKRLYGICPESLRALEAFPWPGNIRQLEHVVQQAVLTSAGSELKLHHLSPMVHSQVDAQSAYPLHGGLGGTLRQSRESSERANILRALEKAGQSRTRAAKLLGVSRVTLYKKMKKYGLLGRESSWFPSNNSSSRPASS